MAKSKTLNPEDVELVKPLLERIAAEAQSLVESEPDRIQLEKHLTQAAVKKRRDAMIAWARGSGWVHMTLLSEPLVNGQLYIVQRSRRRYHDEQGIPEGEPMVAIWYERHGWIDNEQLNQFLGRSTSVRVWI